MNLVKKIEQWGDHHHPGVLDVMRIALGLFLLLKGVAFMQNTSDLKNIIENQSTLSLSPWVMILLVYYATFVHMAGGALIALGVFTRLSALLQLPLVLGAMFFVNVLLSPLNTELWTAATCLVLLVVFMIVGSGKFSLDNYLRNLNN